MAVLAHEPDTAPDSGARRPGLPVAGFAAILAVLAGAAGAAVTRVALTTSRGQDLDQRAMLIFSLNGDRESFAPLMDLLNTVSIGSVALASFGFVIFALLRRRFLLAVGAATLVLGANLLTQVLKRIVLTREDFGFGTSNSLPSGHTTVVFSLALAALLVTPPALRMLVTVIGSALATLTGVATVVAGWHRPSDVVVALCVTVATAAVISALLALLAPAHRPRGRLFEVAALLGAGIAGVLLLVWGVSPGTGDGEARAAVVTLCTIGFATAIGTGLIARLTSRTAA